MPDFHHVNFRTFAHATEDIGKVKRALALVAADAPTTDTAVEGSHGNPIVIVEATLSRAAEIRAFWARVAEAGHLPQLLAEVESRLDEGGVFFMRFSKQAAFEGRLELARDDDAIQVRAKPASFPASREGARTTLLRALEKFI